MNRIVRRVDDLQLELTIVVGFYEEGDLGCLLAPSLSLLLLELLPLKLQRALLSTVGAESYRNRYCGGDKRHQGEDGANPGSLGGDLLPVRHVLHGLEHRRLDP